MQCTLEDGAGTSELLLISRKPIFGKSAAPQDLNTHQMEGVTLHCWVAPAAKLPIVHTSPQEKVNKLFVGCRGMGIENQIMSD